MVKMLKNALFHKIEESEKKPPGCDPWSESAPKYKCFFLDPYHIIPPSFVEICLVVFE